jgi:hypothetical protein
MDPSHREKGGKKLRNREEALEPRKDKARLSLMLFQGVHTIQWEKDTLFHQETVAFCFQSSCNN